MREVIGTFAEVGGPQAHTWNKQVWDEGEEPNSVDAFVLDLFASFPHESHFVEPQ